MKKILLTALLLILTQSLYADGHNIKAGPVKQKDSHAVSEEKLTAFQFCQIESECTATINGCCGCPDVAVAKSQLEEFKGQLGCEDVTCERKYKCKMPKARCYLYRCTIEEDADSY